MDRLSECWTGYGQRLFRQRHEHRLHIFEVRHTIRRFGSGISILGICLNGANDSRQSNKQNGRQQHHRDDLVRTHPPQQATRLTARLGAWWFCLAGGRALILPIWFEGQRRWLQPVLLHWLALRIRWWVYSCHTLLCLPNLHCAPLFPQRLATGCNLSAIDTGRIISQGEGIAHGVAVGTGVGTSVGAADGLGDGAAGGLRTCIRVLVAVADGVAVAAGTPEGVNAFGVALPAT